MNTINQNEIPAIGTALAGGFYAGLYQFNGDKFALIVAPKAQGQTEDIHWGDDDKKIAANSPIDGHANTQALISAGFPLGQWALGLDINGYKDWYVPARDELEICYRNLKPTAQENYCSYRDGENNHSIPPMWLYEDETPTQTPATIFQDEQPEAFDPRWYWSSTQYSANDAFVQDFIDGGQYSGHKDNRRRARAVRRLLVI
jgi:hypothetical protein